MTLAPHTIVFESHLQTAFQRNCRLVSDGQASLHHRQVGFVRIAHACVLARFVDLKVALPEVIVDQQNTP